MADAPSTPGTDLVPTATADQVRAVMAQVTAGKLDLAEVLQSLLGDSLPAPAADSAAPAVRPITEAQQAALVRLPSVYGRVAPEAPVLLSPEQLAQLMEERETLDEILSLAKLRKDQGIRETVANHFDRKAEAEGRVDEATPRVKGHYAVKDEQEVPGTAKKFQKIVSDPRPALPSGEDLLVAYERGQLTRKEYLSLTREVPRAVDVPRAVEAIKRDPALLFKVGRLARPGAHVVTIKAQ